MSFLAGAGSMLAILAGIGALMHWRERKQQQAAAVERQRRRSRAARQRRLVRKVRKGQIKSATAVVVDALRSDSIAPHDFARYALGYNAMVRNQHGAV